MAYTRCLSDCTLYLETHAVAPLEELHRRLRYRVELIQHVYAAQVQILQGTGTGDGEASPALLLLLGGRNKTPEDFRA